ncbi:UDP-3-O-acylglucosamine N-acyltransferase [Planktothrix tepida]|uniref:UDP-3-O-acylglucosamine N-acyltransferase n=2 Tax=Planktothrix TaxID=54304 RepID=A0A1J1LTV2_9CYAN|nr:MULTISPECIES: UDP-3-O-(3-hydroxymyristoyl)glucosamine N-acyltransferase [Planktothrix]CAD5931459.1 UDP-3-O-acylglucosamine N-acyltransferase [Planktothrix pseudagardhii]CAD5977818.1 UDP-3-O-acylglucosamine N-acyltransferase [Planktothrix tepida]CUR36021.1 UDP-3-O-acylglucosamine N-acyltransferase [Planktothrix tepida PCC 9214]
MKFSELVEKLNSGITGHSLTDNPSLDPDIHGVAAVDKATSGTLSYIEGLKFASFVQQSAASALILPVDEGLQTQATERGLAWVAGANPRAIFAAAIALFYQPYQPQPSIHPSAVIDPSAQIGSEVYIGPHVVIQAGVTIGNQVCLHPNVVIYPQVTIGDRTILHANCTIHERAQIGCDCVIHSGAVIGAEGFGFVPTASGWMKMEQSGITVLEDGVEVGCNSTIDRPAVGETRIGKATKLDNLVHIGHGCTIGENCAFAAQVGLAGGVTIGNGVLLAGQVGISNQVKVGDGVIVTAQSGVHHNISRGEMVSGSPALANKLYLKTAAVYRRLPELYQSLKALERRFRDS